VDVNNIIKAIIMKKSIFFSLLLSAALFQSCKPELKEIGPEFAAGEGIYGSWIVSDLSQVDLTVPLPESQNIFSYFSSNESNKMIIRFDRENNAYSIIQPGMMPRILGTSGTWAYNEMPYPTAINFYTSKGDTLSANLGNMPRETDNQFKFKLNRTDSCGTNYLRYDYTFSRVQ
jgi:hypothetical protein